MGFKRVSKAELAIETKASLRKLLTWGEHLVKGVKILCNRCKPAEANPTHLLITRPELADENSYQRVKNHQPGNLQPARKSTSGEKV